MSVLNVIQSLMSTPIQTSIRDRKRWQMPGHEIERDIKYLKNIILVLKTNVANITICFQAKMLYDSANVKWFKAFCLNWVVMCSYDLLEHTSRNSDDVFCICRYWIFDSLLTLHVVFRNREWWYRLRRLFFYQTLLVLEWSHLNLIENWWVLFELLL